MSPWWAFLRRVRGALLADPRPSPVHSSAAFPAVGLPPSAGLPCSSNASLPCSIAVWAG